MPDAPVPVAKPKRKGTLAMLGRPRTLWRFLRDRNAPALPRVLAVLAILYVIFPIDAIPDFAPIIGWIDDAGVASMVIAYVAAAASRYEAAQGELAASNDDKQREPQRAGGA